MGHFLHAPTASSGGTRVTQLTQCTSLALDKRSTFQSILGLVMQRRRLRHACLAVSRNEARSAVQSASKITPWATTQRSSGVLDDPPAAVRTPPPAQHRPHQSHSLRRLSKFAGHIGWRIGASPRTRSEPFETVVLVYSLPHQRTSFQNSSATVAAAKSPSHQLFEHRRQPL